MFLPDWQKRFPVQLELKSITGITLANIFTGELESGYQKIEWSGESNSTKLPSGVYLVQMRSNNTIQTVRVLLLN
jgi:flagellar hook assembly protein FlgD